MDQEPGVRGQRGAAGASRSSSAACCVDGGRSPGSHHLQEAIGPVHPLRQQGPGALEPPQIGDPDAAATVLVLVGRADPPPRRAELLALLARRIEQLVIGEHQVGAVGDEDPPGGGDAPLGELVQLAEERLRLEHHPVADHAGDPRMEDAGGESGAG